MFTLSGKPADEIDCNMPVINNFVKLFNIFVKTWDISKLKM